MSVPKIMRSFLWSLLAMAMFLGLASFLKTTLPANPMRSARGASFARGVLHGALMPLALPPILAGGDIPIYDVSNTGRGYHLGYILGVNLCGFVFIPPMARALRLGLDFLKRKRDDSGVGSQESEDRILKNRNPSKKGKPSTVGGRM